jgi:hypothetical protein
MKNILVGILISLALFATYHAYLWKKVADQRGWEAEVAYTWLAQEIAHDINGKPVTRAAILDQLAKAQIPK